MYNFLAENSSLSEEAGADADEARQEADQTLSKENKRIQDAQALQAKRQADKEQEEQNEQAEQLQQVIEGLTDLK